MKKVWQTDRRTDRQTEIGVLRAAWSQLKNHDGSRSPVLTWGEHAVVLVKGKGIHSVSMTSEVLHKVACAQVPYLHTTILPWNNTNSTNENQNPADYLVQYIAHFCRYRDFCYKDRTVMRPMKIPLLVIQHWNSPGKLVKYWYFLP